MNRRTIGLVVMLAAGAASSADLNGWQKKMPITFSGYSRAEALTNYPALVVLSTNLSGFSYADFLSTNADLRFTDSTQTNELSYEVDAWDTNGSSYVWVQVPLLTNSAVIQAFWGMNGQTAPAYTTNGTVWSQGFSGVYHFRQGSPAPDLRDSSPNAYHGLNSNTTSTATGRVGYAANFPGVDQFVTLTNGNKYLPIPNTPITVSTWFQVRGIGANNLDNRLFSIPRWYGSTGLGAGFGYTNKYQVFWNYGAGSEQYEVSIASNTWYHMALSFNGSQFTCYLNGNRWASSVNSLTNDIDSSLACIGSGPAASGAQPYNGIVDEFQISSVGRSSNWVWACYMSQASNNVFNTYGAAQPPSFPEITNIGSQNPSTASMEVVGRLITNGTSATTVTLYWSTTDGRTNAPDWTAGGSERDLGVQAAGAVFTNTLTGLASNTTYYWNHKAVNASGTVWAATAGSPSFSLFAVTGKTGTTTQVGDWSNSATWVSGYIPQGGDVAIVNHNIALSNSTPLLAAYTINAGKTNTFCTLNAALNAIQVNVYGTLTHTNNTATSTVGGLWIPNGRVVINCSNLLVETNGSINVDTRGYGGRGASTTGSGYGPGGGGGWGNGAGGGGYGGNGGAGVNSVGAESSPAGPANGIASAPDQPGSGGGNCNGGAAAGAGGGLVWIQATQGTVTVNGQISANGGYLSTPGSDRGGGGSGGGIYIACKTFAGTNGLLSVIGGIPQGWWPGGGGGGRIAVVVDPATQAGAPAVSVQFRCAGGLGRDGGGNGASGTLYVNDSRVLPTVWNGRTASAVLLGFSSWSPAQLAITNAALSVGARLQLNVSSHLSLAGTTNSDALTLTNASSLICGGDLSISNTSLSLTPGVDSTPPTLTVNGNVSMVNTGRLYVYAAMTNSTSRTGAWVNVAGTMTLTKGSVVYPSGQPINGGSICFTVTNLNITDTTSGFDADGKGYWGAPANTSANGFGPGGGKFGTGGSAYAGGGGYGGLGGDGGSAPASGGGIYGVSNAPPVFAGSGGGNKNDGPSRAGDGGGLIWIEAGGTLTLNGYLKASGVTPDPSSGGRGGGGSGGGIYLKCRTLQGTTGSLTANGSVGRRWAGGGGGGGRIQVWSVTNQTSGLTASVQPGTGTDGGTTGAVGTVYWGTLPENNFSLPVISNGSALNLSNTSADVVGTLVSNGIPAAVVYLYWSTNNGMTNATAWTTGGSVSNLGSRAEGATFTNTLTDLTPNTTYFWTYSASNSVATAWAATNGSSFATRGPPGVNNAGGATDISQYGATLNGNLTNGGVASVSILLGTEDGVWSVTNNLGTTNHGPFSCTVTGLSFASPYYYTCYASNAYGTALAGPSVAFTTRQGLVYYWVGASNANWSATSSWSTTSGGAPGAGVPGPLDDAIFDAGGVSNALIDAAFAGTVYSVSVNAGYRGTITQSNSLTVAHDFSMSTGAWQFVTDRPGTLTVGNNMTVSNATLYCQRVSTVGNGTGRVITVGGNLTVASTGRINAFALGFNAASGPGAGGGYGTAGASHGGRGGAFIWPPSSFVVAKDTYGSVTGPTSLGSGGDYVDATDQSPGGGAVKLAVGGTLRLDGTVTANAGLTTFVHNGGGGAGGSVWIVANDLAGAGTVSANGRGGTHNSAAQGGGGRIAVYTANTFGNVGFQTFDGGNGILCGAAGTIYLENTSTQSPGQGTLIINNNHRQPTPGSSTMIPIGQTWTFPTVILTNAGVLGVVSNTYSVASVNLQVDAANRNTAILLDYATLDVGQTFAFSNYIVNLYRSSFLTATNITVGTNAVLRIDNPNTATGDVTIAAGGMMDHRTWWGGTDVEWFKLNLTLQGNLTIQPGGSINLTGKGYSAGSGPAAGGAYGSAAASHGGRGGKCIQGGATNNSLATYGSVVAPTNWGSGADGVGTPASTGGGALKLNVAGTLTVNGPILADGQDQSHNGGCGAGGSIHIVANDFAGTNLISARGANSSYSSQSSGGGGGRIALYTSNSFGSVSVQAPGQYGAFGSGAAGTIYLKGPADIYGRLIVDNANVTTLADVTTRIPPNNFAVASSNLDVGPVTIAHSGNLQVPTGMTLVVHGYWTNRAAFTADTNSTVVLAGTNAATTYGNTTFFNLTSTNMGKVLTFEAGKTNTVLGALTLDNLTLLSTVDGAWWYLTQPTNAPQNIRAVIVKDSNASGGQTLYATRGNSLGNNINWWFPAKGSSFMFR